jgi:hypothetical protein
MDQPFSSVELKMSIKTGAKGPEHAPDEGSKRELAFTIPLEYDKLETDQLDFSPFTPIRARNTNQSD